MFSILASLPILFTSPQYCQEMKQDLNNAVERQLITQQQADDITQLCFLTYTKGH